MKVITIANQKGGVGKTTTCQTFACGLVLKGYKVLAIDCDSQRNMTFTFNGMNHEGKNIFNVLLQEPIEEAIIKTNQKVDLIPSSDKLYIADSVFSQADDIYRLKLQLQKIADNYDYCIIDTPPTLNTIIIPMLTDSFSMQGLSQLLATIEATKEAQRRKGIKEVKIEGILLTQYNDRTILNRMLTNQIEKISNQTGLNVFKTTIRKGVIVGEAQNNQSNVFALNPKANVSKDYDSFIKEYLKSYK
jgi:chromosome partitioning protein